MTIKVIKVRDVPAGQDGNSKETKTITFETVDAALRFAERNGGKLVGLAPGAFTFRNLSGRKAEEIVP